MYYLNFLFEVVFSRDEKTKTKKVNKQEGESIWELKYLWVCPSDGNLLNKSYPEVGVLGFNSVGMVL